MCRFYTNHALAHISRLFMSASSQAAAFGSSAGACGYFSNSFAQRSKKFSQSTIRASRASFCPSSRRGRLRLWIYPRLQEQKNDPFDTLLGWCCARAVIRCHASPPRPGAASSAPRCDAAGVPPRLTPRSTHRCSAENDEAGGCALAAPSCLRPRNAPDACNRSCG